MDRKVRPLSSSNTMTLGNSAPPLPAPDTNRGALPYEEVVFIVVVLFGLFSFLKMQNRVSSG